VITFDGDRSLKRKWFAKKQLAIIQEIDVPAKAVKWDGFNFKVWQLGEDLNGGRVTAPMGAVVACSSANGIKIAVADYWAGGFNAEQDLYVVFKDLGVSGEFTTFFEGAIDIPPDPIPSDYEPTYYPMKFIPAIGTSWFGLVDGDTVGPDSVEVDNFPCGPVPLPWKGEAYDIMVGGTMKYDLDGNGVYDWFRHVFEKNTSFYLAAGQQALRKNCIAKHIEYDINFDPLRTYQKTGTDRYTSYHGAYIYDFVDSIKVVGYNIDVTTSTVDNIQFSEILTTAMPETLRLILIHTLNDGSCEPIGSYATDNMFFHAVNATTHIWSSGGESCAAKDYYDDNPGNDDWRLFYSMTVDGVTHLVNYGQFGALLNSLSLHGTSGSWYDAMRMFSQLVGAYPNCNWTVPYDSIMFHDDDNNLYTWTRPYGPVKISKDGIEVIEMSIPSEVVDNDGVRPEITYAGRFVDYRLYLCICNKVKEEVKAVYIGNPFPDDEDDSDDWIKLPHVDPRIVHVTNPDEDVVTCVLFHVRPVRVTPTSVFLIGITKDTTLYIDDQTGEYIRDESGELTKSYHYHFASLIWSVDLEGNATTDIWTQLARLPFTASDNDNLQVGLYGDDSRVNELAAYLTPPPIMPQSPVGPYDKYSIGLP